MKKVLLILIIFVNLNSLSGQSSVIKIPSTFFEIMDHHGIAQGIAHQKKI